MKRVFIGLIGIFLLIIWVYQDLVSLLQYNKKFEHIYFTGFDATGIGHEMIKTADSHFYGNDKELENKPTAQFAIDLLMHSRHLHDLNRLALYCKNHKIQITNITNGGLLDMFPRKNILPILDV